jgi:hypothetical protein
VVALFFYFSSGYYHNAIPAIFKAMVLAFASFCCYNLRKGFENYVAGQTLWRFAQILGTSNSHFTQSFAILKPVFLILLCK